VALRADKLHAHVELSRSTGDEHSEALTSARAMRLAEYLDGLKQDFRYAARGFIRRPGFTAVAVILSRSASADDSDLQRGERAPVAAAEACAIRLGVSVGSAADGMAYSVAR